MYLFKSKLLNKFILLSGIVGFIFSLFAEWAVLLPPQQVFGNEIVIYTISVILSILIFISPAFYCIYYHERHSKS